MPPQAGLSTPEGMRLAHDLLRPQLPHDIHDYILEGICKAIDGTHVLAVMKTGGGKTGYFYGYILLLRALQKIPSPLSILKTSHPKNPAMVLVFPTKGLQEEMEAKFHALNITAIAINEDTLLAARQMRRNLWHECIEDTSMILLSPEQLTSQPFDRLLQHEVFSSRLCALGIDEVHLVQDWGDPSFRDAFRHIALVHARMPRGTVLIGLTATLLAGQETTELLKTLGLTPGTFFFQRRSNIRHDVRDIYRVLRHGLSGWNFPDLDWVLEGNRKTLIYCGNFSLGFRLCTYFRYKGPRTIIRLYNSISFSSYNSSTRRLFVDDPATQIIIATDALVVGIDFPNVEDVIDLDCHHPNHGKQRKGRAGRPGGNVRSPRGITYVTKATIEKAKKMVEKYPSHDGGKQVEQGLHIGQARLLLAPCYPACEDILYDNPSIDPPCSCETCRVEAQSTEVTERSNPRPPNCNCSGCQPEAPLPPLPRSTQGLPTIPMELRLTEKMVKQGTIQLKEFRQHLWNEKSDAIGHLPPFAFLPDAHIKNILDNFSRIKTLQDLSLYIGDLHLLSGLESRLFALISEMHLTFASFPQPERKKAVRPPASSSISAQLPKENSVADGSHHSVATVMAITAPGMTVDQPGPTIPVPSPTYNNFWSNFKSTVHPLTHMTSTPNTTLRVEPPAMQSSSTQNAGSVQVLAMQATSIPTSPLRIRIPLKRKFQEEMSLVAPLSPQVIRRSKRGKENK